MLHSSELWSRKDDWTDLTDATERRKCQSRLAQRARRKRKHQERMTLDMALDTSIILNEPAETSVSQRSTAPVPPSSTSANAIVLSLALTLLVERKPSPEIRERILAFLRKVCTNWMMSLPDPADLPTLTRLNTLDALIRNALMLRIPFELLESDDLNSSFLIYGPRQITSRSFPPCLGPTPMQKRIPHHSWLDLFPIPRMRDNILWGICTGQLDEDQLCMALCCDLLNVATDSTADLIIWGEPWDMRGWELVSSFFESGGYFFTDAQKYCRQQITGELHEESISYPRPNCSS